MLRQASSRNQRAKGFRLKHALQIGILVAICIWLLYQVKHSHDKKRAYDARNSKVVTKVIENPEDFFNFGRKDLTRTEAATVHTNHKEEESEETQEEEEPEIKQEETEDEEVRGAEQDGIDAQDQENADGEAEHVEDPTEEEDKEGQMEETDQSDSQDHEGGTQAREENYKRDDASSAVVHDTRATESETVTINAKSTGEEQLVDVSKGDFDSISDGSKVDVSEDNTEKQEKEAENVVSGTVDGSKGDNGTIDGSMNDLSDVVKDNGTMPDVNFVSNGTSAASALISNSTIVEYRIETDLLTNNTTEAESNSQMELSANSTASISVNQTEGQNNSTLNELHTEVQTSNDTVSLDSSRDPNDKGAQGEEVESKVENVVYRDEKSNSTNVLDSGEQSTTSSATNGNEDAGLQETDDSLHAVMEEERDARTDLSTLPSIENEAKTVDEEAAE
ncbi:uncharacterized protein M6B38_284405 [Iris pallida]|uniref:Uncharacterized protein n=1 Tax=Iris pallida TaxID=29817 RepID=A0AAX6I2L2_IRIPA|nr:uncharacterized protein M6B38_284405 [Iris pallida]